MASYYLTAELTEKAVGLVLDGIILPMMERGEVKRPHLHIVVGVDRPMDYWDSTTADDGVIYEQSIGDPTMWEYDYRGIAQGKYRQTRRTGLPSRVIQQIAPHLYIRGDTIHAGSTNLIGIIVACSGVESFWDEAFAGMIAWAIWGLIKKEDEQIRRDHPNLDFLE